MNLHKITFLVALHLFVNVRAQQTDSLLHQKINPPPNFIQLYIGAPDVLRIQLDALFSSQALRIYNIQKEALEYCH